MNKDGDWLILGQGIMSGSSYKNPCQNRNWFYHCVTGTKAALTGTKVQIALSG